MVKRADTTEAEKLLNETTSLNRNDYTEDSWKVFETARKELEKAVKDTSDINDEQMKALMQKVRDARDGLVTKNPNKPIDPEKPSDPIKPEEDSKDETNTGDATSIASTLLLLLVSGAGLVLLKKKSRQ